MIKTRKFVPPRSSARNFPRSEIDQSDPDQQASAFSFSETQYSLKSLLKCWSTEQSVHTCGTALCQNLTFWEWKCAVVNNGLFKILNFMIIESLAITETVCGLNNPDWFLQWQDFFFATMWSPDPKPIHHPNWWVSEAHSMAVKGMQRVNFTSVQNLQTWKPLQYAGCCSNC
jgi:hypothetical protein